MKLGKIFACAQAAVLFLLCMSLPAAAIDSSDDPYVVTLYNESNGLPTGEANEVIQTSA